MNTILTHRQQLFLQLIRSGIGNTDNSDTIIDVNLEWESIIALSERQGLSGILTDAIEHIPQDIRPTKLATLQLIGNVFQNYERRYKFYCEAIADLAAFYNAHGFKMMVLKGYACSINWPKPEHRPSGDIDIWLFGKWKDADSFLVSEKGVKIDSSHHHHTVFFWRNFMVENHYDFINVYARKSNAKLEMILKELGADDSHFKEVQGARVYLPSSNLHALFLIRHAASHFAAAEITLRHVLDWAFFVKEHGLEVDWEWLDMVLEEYGIKPFFDILNAICIEDLGFDPSIFPIVHFNLSEKERVLCDILEPEYVVEQPDSLLPRLLYRYRRWQANAWKQRLCFKESRWSAFWTGLWNHLLKPSSI